MQAILNKTNIDLAHSKAGARHTREFNCWGGTLFALDNKKELEWVNQTEMTNFLADNTSIIDEECQDKGDILCLYKYEALMHTAICISKDYYWHKMGVANSAYTNLEGVLSEYSDDYDAYTIRRLNK